MPGCPRECLASTKLPRPHGVRWSARLQAPDHRCPGLPAPCRSTGREVHACALDHLTARAEATSGPSRMRRGQSEPGRRMRACSSYARTASAATGICRRRASTRGSAPTSARSASSAWRSGSAAPARTAAGARAAAGAARCEAHRRPGLDPCACGSPMPGASDRRRTSARTRVATPPGGTPWPTAVPPVSTRSTSGRASS